MSRIPPPNPNPRASRCTFVSVLRVQVTVEYGGSEEQVIIVLVLHCLTEPSALLVTDAKGRIQFANTELGQIVGYRPQTLTEGMNLSALLPPPYAQLHTTFMKVRREFRV